MPTTPAGREFLAANAKVLGVVSLPSGLQYKVLQAAKPGAQSPLLDTLCECHFRGTLVDGTEFDSSYRRGKPTTFAPAQVIKGWQEAMQLMAEGDKWLLYLPSELAYGDSVRGAHITPGAVLIFDLEILSVLGDADAKTAVVHTAESRAALCKPPSGPPPPHAEKGKRVQVIGLEAKPEFNGQVGTVISWDEARQRAGVRFDSGASFALKPANLWATTETADDDEVPAPSPASASAPAAAAKKVAFAEAAPTKTVQEMAAAQATKAAKAEKAAELQAKRAAALVDVERDSAATAAAENAAAVKAAAAAMATAEQAVSDIPMPPPPAAIPVAPPIAPPMAAAFAPPRLGEGTPADGEPAEVWCSGMHEVSGGFVRAPGKEPGAQGVVMVDDGKVVVTRTYEGDVEKVGLYCVASGAALRCFEGHTDVVTAIAVDGDTLASAAADGTARLWDLSLGSCFASANVGEAVCGVGLRGEHLITGDAAQKAILWHLDDTRPDPQAPRARGVLSKVGTQEHSGTVFCAGVTADGAACSVGFYQSDLKFWGGGCDTSVEVTLPAASGYSMVVEGKPCRPLPPSPCPCSLCSSVERLPVL